VPWQYLRHRGTPPRHGDENREQVCAWTPTPVASSHRSRCAVRCRFVSPAPSSCTRPPCERIAETSRRHAPRRPVRIPTWGGDQAQRAIPSVDPLKRLLGGNRR
jgi:hypothetical protein